MQNLEQEWQQLKENFEQLCNTRSDNKLNTFNKYKRIVVKK